MRISTQYLAEVRLKREEVKSFDKYPFSLAAVRPLEPLAEGGERGRAESAIWVARQK